MDNGIRAARYLTVMPESSDYPHIPLKPLIIIIDHALHTKPIISEFKGGEGN
ncbi:MAG: hypothetical protein QXH09_02610 [Candidatus Bathyarchaeia archaeon]